MCRTKGARPVTLIEIQAARRMLIEDGLKWRDVGRILRRDHTTLQKAVKRHIGRAEGLGVYHRRHLSTEERFHQSYEKHETGCWVWALSKRGKYGRFKVSDRFIGAHRWAYEWFNGPIPDGMHVCHKCDNPLCVNPAHLFVGTPKENTADMVSKGRAVRGAASPNAKLTDDIVREIRANANLGARPLARKYGIGATTIKRVLKRETWRHVE